MYYPFCKRCHTKDNFGDHTCGSCRITLKVAKEVNTILYDFKGDKTKTARFLGASRSTFYKFASQVPEIYSFWDGIEGVRLDDTKKVIGYKTRNKMNFTEHRLWKKVLRLREFADIAEDKQAEFVEWFHENSTYMTLSKAKEKLRELDGDVIRV